MKTFKKYLIGLSFFFIEFLSVFALGVVAYVILIYIGIDMKKYFTIGQQVAIIDTGAAFGSMSKSLLILIFVWKKSNKLKKEPS